MGHRIFSEIVGEIIPERRALIDALKKEAQELEREGGTPPGDAPIPEQRLMPD